MKNSNSKMLCILLCNCFFALGMNPNESSKHATIKLKFNKEYCLEKILSNAIVENNKKTVFLVLKKGYEINKIHCGCKVFGPTLLTDTTLLHLAVQKECKEIMDKLLEYGANPNIKDTKGKTALYYASNLVFNKRLGYSASLNTLFLIKHHSLQN